MSLQIQPLGDRVIVLRSDQEVKSAGGIVIPDTAKEKPVEGVVVAVGPGKRAEGGQLHALTVKAKDKVLFGKYAGTEVKLNGKEYIVMREDDIIGIVTQ